MVRPVSGDRLRGAFRGAILGLLTGLPLGNAGCDSPAVPSSLPPPPPPATRLSGDYRTSARCGEATVTAGVPERIDYSAHHSPYYAVDISVEGPASEGMMLDFLRWYDTSDWRVRMGGGRVRHDFRVYWDPYDASLLARASLPGVRPMTIVACPEEEGGPVLACSERSCAVYGSEDAVPEVLPADVAIVFRSPWGFAETQELREGETLEIPISYRVYRDVRRFGLVPVPPLTPRAGELGTDLEVTPGQIERSPLRAGASGTVVFRATALADGLEEEESEEIFVIDFVGWSTGKALWLNKMTLRILDPP